MFSSYTHLLFYVFSPIAPVELLLLAYLVYLRRYLASSILVLFPVLAILRAATAPGTQPATWSDAPLSTFSLQPSAPIPVLPPLSGWALIQVSHAAVNPADFKVFRHFAAVPFVRWIAPANLAHEGSGTVIESTCELKKGDQVYGIMVAGTAQPVTLTLCLGLAKKPASVSFAKASGAAVAVVTAWHGLASRVKPGDSVLVIGAAGGCGSAGVLMAKSLGAKKVVCVASKANKELSLGPIGCDEFFDYRSADFHKDITARYAHAFPVIYDSVSDQSTDYYALCRDLVTPQGVIVTLEGPVSDHLARFASAVGLDLGRPQRVMVMGLPSRAIYDDIASRHLSVLEGLLVPQVYEWRNQTQVRSLIELSLSHRAKGKLVLRVGA